MVAYHFGGFDYLRQLGRDVFEVDVGGGSGQPILVEQALHFFGRIIEVTGELDFAVADFRDLLYGAGEVSLHLVAHGIELNADFFDLALGCPAQTFRHNSGSGHGSQKATTIHVQAPMGNAQTWYCVL